MLNKARSNEIIALLSSQLPDSTKRAHDHSRKHIIMSFDTAPSVLNIVLGIEWQKGPRQCQTC